MVLFFLASSFFLFFYRLNLQFTTFTTLFQSLPSEHNFTAGNLLKQRPLIFVYYKVHWKFWLTCTSLIRNSDLFALLSPCCGSSTKTNYEILKTPWCISVFWWSSASVAEFVMLYLVISQSVCPRFCAQCTLVILRLSRGLVFLLFQLFRTKSGFTSNINL